MPTKQTNRQKTQTPNKQQKTTREKTLQTNVIKSSLHRRSLAELVQWIAFVKSQMKLADIPGQPPPWMGMAPTVTGEQAATSDQRQLWGT